MFSERLKSLRLEADLTQAEVAKHFDISQPAYAQWENGIKKPKQDKLERIANFFHVSTDYLLGRSNIRNPNENSEIECLINQLDAEQKEKTLRFIKNLIKSKP